MRRSPSTQGGLPPVSLAARQKRSDTSVLLLFFIFYEFFMDSSPKRVSEFKSRVLHVHFTVAKHGFVLFIFINQLIKQRSAAVKDIFICHFEIS